MAPTTVFSPSQETIPRGGFGNLIALPSQKKPRENGNTLFLEEHLDPYPDQWAFLASVNRMSHAQVQAVIGQASTRSGILGVPMVSTDENDNEPWLDPPSRHKRDVPISGPLPKKIELVLANQIYIEKENLPPGLMNRLIRLAAFQNPQFYKAQGMRFPTFDKPRIINCCEDFPRYIGIPRGCLEDVVCLLESLGIETVLKDERFGGHPIEIRFQGTLTPPLTIHELYAALICDKKRNDMIVDDVLKSVKVGRSPLLLTERREHLKTLETLLESKVANVIVVKGGMGKKQRKAVSDRMQALGDGQERVIISTGRYLGEGFDDPRLDTLFLSLPVSWKGVLIQYAGRLHRLHDSKKEVLIYDYLDSNVPTAVKMFERRRKGYGAIGYVIDEHKVLHT